MPGGTNAVARLNRAVRLSSGAPLALTLARSGARDAATTVATVLAPLVNSSVPAAEQQHILDSLHRSGARFSYLSASWSRMTTATHRPDLAVLAGAFSRLYDDLFDEISDPEAQDRLGQLFRGQDFTPTNHYEVLLQRILTDICERMDERGQAPMLAALEGLHRFQQESRRQCDPDVTAARSSGSAGARAVWPRPRSSAC